MFIITTEQLYPSSLMAEWWESFPPHSDPRGVQASGSRARTKDDPALPKMILISRTRLDEYLIDDLFSPWRAAQWQQVCCSVRLRAALGAEA